MLIMNIGKREFVVGGKIIKPNDKVELKKEIADKLLKSYHTEFSVLSIDKEEAKNIKEGKKGKESKEEKEEKEGK